MFLKRAVLHDMRLADADADAEWAGDPVECRDGEVDSQ